MVKYKTILVDYEGMQNCLDSHGAVGWRLVSLTPDTWRKVISHAEDDEPHAELMGSTPSGSPEQEYCASYYLLVFAREDNLPRERGLAAASEELPESERGLSDH